MRLRKWEIKRRELEIDRSPQSIVAASGCRRSISLRRRGDERYRQRPWLAIPAVGSTAVEEMLDGNFQEVGHDI